MCTEQNAILTFLVVGNQGFGDGLTDSWKTTTTTTKFNNGKVGKKNPNILTADVNMKRHINHRENNVLLTVDLCDVSATLHSDSDVNSSETLLAQQQHWLQKLKREREREYIVKHIKKEDQSW